MSVVLPAPLGPSKPNISLSATPDRILALFSGRTRGQSPGRANYGKIVHIFDWNGQYLEAMALDRDVLMIAAPDTSGRFCALVESPEPAVVCYRLPHR